MNTKTASKPAKTPKIRIPPSPWARAIVLKDGAGLRKGTRVIVRKSREGGWRIVSQYHQLVVTDATVATWIRALRTNGHVAFLGPWESLAADLHLARLFKAGIVPGSVDVVISRVVAA